MHGSIAVSGSLERRGSGEDVMVLGIVAAVMLLALPFSLSGAAHAGWATAVSLLARPEPSLQTSALERLNGPTWTRAQGGSTLYSVNTTPPARFGALTPTLAAPAVRLGSGARTIPTAADLAAVEQQVLAHANRDRVEHGLPQFTWDEVLVPLARQRSLDQTALPRISHFDETGAAPLQSFLHEAGIGYLRAGENIARQEWRGGESAQWVQRSFMASPTHRAVLLDPQLDHAGIGATIDERGRLTVVQVFRSPAR